MVLDAVSRAGGQPDPVVLEESRGADQVLEVVRLGFEIAVDVALVTSGLKALQQRFPGLTFRIDRDEPQGRHER